MQPYFAAIITGLSILLVSSLIIFILIIRHMKDQRKWERIAEDNYLLGKDEAADILRETWEKAAADRQLLESYSEKELLMRVLLTQDSQNRRLDRLEEKLKCISHYRTYIQDMSAKAQKLSQGFVLLEENMASANGQADALRQTVAQTGGRMEDLIKQLSGMDRLEKTVSGYAAQLQNIELTLEFLQDKTAQIVENMRDVTTTHDQSPAKRMKTIEMEITGLSLLVNSLHDSVTELLAQTERIGEKLEADQREQMDD